MKKKFYCNPLMYSVWPPVCIFQLKNIPKERFPNGVVIRANEKGWNNEYGMLWWIGVKDHL
jgi:hypothetical protein